MKGKLLLCTMILCMSTLLPLTTNAASTPAEISQALQGVEAYMINSDGECIELNITDIEVEQIPLPTKYRNRSNSADIVAYAATAKTKTGTTSYKKNGINAASSLTMTWVDGPGVDNEITNLKGYFSVAQGTFDYGIIYWGSTYSGPTWAPNVMDVGETFDEDINYTSEDTLAGKVRADSIGYIVSPKDGKTYQITLQVSPTIFD